MYRIDPSGEVAMVADDFERPDGPAFSRNGERLYVVDTKRGHLRAFGARRAARSPGARRSRAAARATSTASASTTRAASGRRRRLLRARWHAPGRAQDPRAGREPSVRRAQAQHSPRLRHDVALLDHAERDGRLSPRSIFSASRA
ncbi:SMP-30/gluconolactonase/LRE family protein [Amycolatopsis sp. FDAARGOS 1241]|nr:SMP-30/gluconolactonase/LRE family protein [Amycolatopsis sp. FDAARGOS 1241]